MEIPGFQKLKDFAHVNEVVQGVPVLVLKAVSLHALILRGIDPDLALKMIAESKIAIASLAKD
jgi:hypothetical protein